MRPVKKRQKTKREPDYKSMLKARLHYHTTEGSGIPVKPNNTRGPRPSWRSAFDVLTNRGVVTTRRDILLLPLYLKIPLFQ